MVDLTTQPADPGIVTINPRSGQFSPGSGRGIARAGAELAEIGGAFLKNRQENRDARSIASFILDQVTTKRDNAAEILSRSFGIDLTEGEVDALATGAKTVKKLDAQRIQRPGRVADTFERVEKLRQSVAANPRLAPEFLQMFEATGGGTVGAQLEDVITQAEKRRADFIENVNTVATETLGLPLNMDFNKKSQRVGVFQQLAAQATVSANHLQILQNDEQTKRITVLNEISSGLVPAATLDMVNVLRLIVQDDLEGQPDKTIDQRKAILIQAQLSIAEIRAAIVGLGGSAISTGDIEVRTPGGTHLMNALEKWVTTGELDLLKNSIELAESVALNDLYAGNPGLPEMFVIAEKFMKNNPMAGSLFDIEVLAKFHPIMEAALASATDHFNAHTVLQLKNLTPEEQVQAFRTFGVTLKAIADSPEVTDEEFGNFLQGLFQEYDSNPGNENLTTYLDAMLEDLADPLVVKRLNSAKLDPAVVDNVRTGLEFYIKDLVESTSNAMKDTFSDNGEFLGGAIVFFGLKEASPPPFRERVEDPVIMPDGTPIYRAKTEARFDPIVQQAVKDLNRRAKKIGQVARVMEALKIDNLQRTARQISAEILSTGVLPNPTDVLPAPEPEFPQEVELRLVRTEREIAEEAIKIEDPKERAQFLRDNGIELPRIVEQVFNL